MARVDPQRLPDSVASREVGVIPENLSPELQSLLSAVQDFVKAESWEQLNSALSRFDDDARLDIPVLFVPGKERIRAINSFIAFFVTRTLDPKVVFAKLSPDKASAELSIESTMHVHPRRRWWLPLTYLLPNDLPIDTTVALGVKGWNDKISFLRGRAHNLPSFPFILRWLYGYGFGTFATAIEPLVSKLLDFYNYAWASAESVSQAGPVETIKTTAAAAYTTVSETVENVTSTVSETIGAAKDKIVDVAQAGLATVQDTAQGVMGRSEGTYASKVSGAQPVQQPHEMFPAGMVH